MKFVFLLFNIFLICAVLAQNNARVVLDKAKTFRQNNLDSHLIYIEKAIKIAELEKNACQKR